VSPDRHRIEQAKAHSPLLEGVVPGRAHQGEAVSQLAARDGVEQLKKLRLQEALKLDEETSVRFFARYNEHQEGLRSIGKRRSEAIDGLQKLVRKNAPDAEIDAQLKTVVASETDVTSIRSKFLEKLRDILTPAQIALYVVFERNFNQDLREIMRENAQERWRGKN